MAAPIQQTTEITTIIIAVLSSSVLAAILTFYFGNISYKRNTSYENKIIEIKNFYKSFQSFKVGIESYHHYTMFTFKDSETTKSISNSLFPLWQDFQYQSMIIKLFLNENDYQNVIEIEKLLFQIKIDMDIFHINSTNPSPSKFGERMLEILEVDLKITLPQLMGNIERSLRKAFV